MTTYGSRWASLVAGIVGDHKMKLPVQALVVTRAGQIAGVGLVVSLLGCVASVGSVARDTFQKSYTCPAGQLTVNPVEEAGASFVEVVGCGHDEEYVCQAGHLGRNIDGVHVDDASPTSCSPRERIAYEATDGSIHEAWGGAGHGAAAAIASAVHDLPCPRASIVAIDDLTLEGCGQRVTYRAVAQNIATPPGHQRITDGRRYMLVGRIPISGAVASATPPPSMPPASSAPGCLKDTDCKGDRVCVQGQCADPKAAPGSPAPTAR